MGMTWMHKWRDADHLTLEWLLHLGGWRTAAEVAEVMESSEELASLALLRLSWRGVVELGPNRGARSTWRLRPDLTE